MSASRLHGLALLLEGESAYHPVWRLQREIWERRRALALPDTLLLLQHSPVLTLGRHGRREHVLAGSRLEVVPIDRGGDVTYHGPGQLTAYFHCDLRAHDLAVKGFVAALEEAVLRALARFGVRGERRAGLTGVWVRGGEPGSEGWAKVAALGVRVARGVSLHGVALNVRGPLEGFREIVPCGLAGERVTSLEEILGAASAPSVESAAAALQEAFGEIFEVEFRGLRAEALVSDAGVEALLRDLRREAVRGARKPRWLRTRLPGGEGYARVRRALQESRLHTVCESARCPNCHECWNAGTATVMILGDACTRGCRFCAVPTRAPGPPDPGEPQEVARAAERLGLRHVVVTSVTRDDLPDGGSAHFVATLRALRERLPAATVELLIPDFGGDERALATLLAERPDVLNHNVETVARLYAAVRPGADYERSLGVLRRAAAAGLRVKSGFMVGLGESAREIRALLREIAAQGCAHVTIGQYLQPARENLPVQRYYTEEEFARMADWAREAGLARVDAGPLVRSSYHAARALQS